MYDDHFGLTGRPFQLTPDPAFWYETATHRRAMAYLGYGLAQGEGFIVITGDIGAGKTTLVGHLIATLDRDALNPLTIVSTAIDASDLLRVVVRQLGADPTGLDKAALLSAIERGLHAVARTGRRTLLIVDEAQALPTAALEELRMLSNFQAGGHALLQIVLLGQPEFRAALHGSDRLEQLRQRVIAIHHLDPMGAGEVAAYVRHRLNVVGWNGRPAFDDGAFAALHRHSDGVPRRLNQLANRVMLHAAIEGAATITGTTVEQVAADLHADLPIPMQSAAPSVADDAVVATSDAHPDAAHDTEADPELALAPLADPVPEPTPVPIAMPPIEVAANDAEPAPRPFRHSWMPMAEASPYLVGETPPTLVLAADAPVEPDFAPMPAADRTVDPDPSSPAAADAIAERLSELEARLDEQDAALRRVLTLLVDWVESDVAAPAPMPETTDEPAPGSTRGYVPIRGAAA